MSNMNIHKRMMIRDKGKQEAGRCKWPEGQQQTSIERRSSPVIGEDDGHKSINGSMKPRHHLEDGLALYTAAGD